MYATNWSETAQSYKVAWMAIGSIQPQWGINTGGSVQTSTLPIPFTNVFIAVSSTNTEWCNSGCSATNTTVTTRAYQSNKPDTAQPTAVNWSVIGCQPQWGYLVTNSSHVYITFPIAISKTFAVISCTDHSGSPNAANTFYSVSNVGMYIGSAIAVGKSWIVLGVS